MPVSFRFPKKGLSEEQRMVPSSNERAVFSCRRCHFRALTSQRKRFVSWRLCKLQVETTVRNQLIDENVSEMRRQEEQFFL